MFNNYKCDKEHNFLSYDNNFIKLSDNYTIIGYVY